MLHQIRRHLRGIAATVLVSVSALGVWSSTVHELDCHDAECLPVVVAHDASAHAFRSAELPAGEREALSSVTTRALAIPVADASVARLVTPAQPPLRAPPAFETFDALA
jgi:hypothetical protein